MSRSTRPTACLTILATLALAPPASANTQIYRFKNGDGETPQDRLVPDGAGGFYGTTTDGNKHGGPHFGLGTLFHLTPPVAPQTRWNYVVLHEFSRQDGKTPSDLVLEADGSLYGTTLDGGSTEKGRNSHGTVFRLTPPAMGQQAWTYAIIKTFGMHEKDGTKLAGNLLADASGALYGITKMGGKYNDGTAYRLTPKGDGKTWTFTNIHDFRLTESGFYARYTGLIGDPNTALYGVDFASGGNCTQGGDNGCGLIYQLQPGAMPTDPWSFRLIYQFRDYADGNAPVGPLVQGPDGTLYGVTTQGGRANAGEVFSLTPPAPPHSRWTKTVLHAFRGGAGGSGPHSGLAMDQDGTLYGNTYTGGVNRRAPCDHGGCGTVFRLSPQVDGGAWRFSILHAFGSPPDGEVPEENQPTIVGNYLYGMTYGGGIGCDIVHGEPLTCYGTIYRMPK